MAYRLAFNPLLVGLVARLNADVPELNGKWFSMVPQDLARPYGEIEGFQETDDSPKDGRSFEVFSMINVFSSGPSMAECNNLLGKALRALTRDPVPALTDGWEIQWVKAEGIQVTKVYDFVEEFFQGSFRCRWKIEDTTGG